jgi:hypothetical protein
MNKTSNNQKERSNREEKISGDKRMLAQQERMKGVSIYSSTANAAPTALRTSMGVLKPRPTAPLI